MIRAAVRGGAVEDVSMDAVDDLRAWKVLAPAGLLAVGAGVSVVSDAAGRRGRRAPALQWFAEGTVGLVLLNGGLSLFGEAVKRRALHDVAARTGGAPGPR
jgi:predicted kinase